LSIYYLEKYWTSTNVRLYSPKNLISYILKEILIKKEGQVLWQSSLQLVKKRQPKTHSHDL